MGNEAHTTQTLHKASEADSFGSGIKEAWQGSQGSVRYELGAYSTAEEAAKVYDRKAMELGFLEEALNFPENVKDEQV